MRVTIYGCGYVGLVTAACLAEIGHDVLVIDIDQEKIQRLQQGQVPIHEQQLPQLIEKHVNKTLQFTTSIDEAVTFARLQFICVGTPEKEDGSADLSAVEQVALTIAEHMQDEKIIVTKSTVPVGTGERLTQLIKEHLSSLDCFASLAMTGSGSAMTQKQVAFSVVSNPEFLREGLAVNDFLQPERIIVGTDNPALQTIFQQLYAPLISEQRPLLFMDRNSAELAKYAANAMLACRISFINEIANLAEVVDADIEKIAQSMGFDSRIGHKFLKAGCGYGGSCFPKDVKAIIHTAQQHQVNAPLLTAIDQANQQQKQVLVKKVLTHFNRQIQGLTFAVWGLAFKPDTDDCRQAPSETVINALLKQGANVQAYDPVAMPPASIQYQDSAISFADSALQALEQADALIIVTEWQQFQSIAIEDILKRLKNPIIFDGRNIFYQTPMPGVSYYPIGAKQQGLAYV